MYLTNNVVFCIIEPEVRVSYLKMLFVFLLLLISVLLGVACNAKKPENKTDAAKAASDKAQADIFAGHENDAAFFA